MFTVVVYRVGVLVHVFVGSHFRSTQLSFILYGYGFLSRGFTDRREIFRGGSATSQTGLLQF